MSKHYDDEGNQSGWTDEKGRHYDDKGNFSGWTDANGRHYDYKGNFSGWTDEKGRHRDDKGNFSGWTDEKGRHYDDKGNFNGWTDSSSRGTSSSTSSTSSSTSRDDSSGSGGGGLEIFFAIVAIAVALIGIAVIAAPIIAPILLNTVENARKKGDSTYVKKWESWSSIASLTALLVVLVAAGAIGFEIATSILGLTASSTSSILSQLIYIVAIIAGIISFTLLFITGISPTALIYLKNKEMSLLSTGETAKTFRLQKYSSVIKTTVISTVVLATIIFIVIPLVNATSKWVSAKIQSTKISSTAVQTTSVIVESTNTALIPTQTQNSTQEKILNTPTLPPPNQDADISGIWDLDFSYYGYTDSYGNFTNRSATENWSISLQQSGNNLTGELLSVNSNYVDSCMNARIEGSISQSDLSLLVYFNGSCCPDEIAKIEGIIQNNKFIGNYQPAKTPSGTCTLSTGDVTGTFLSTPDLQTTQIPTPYLGNFSACIEPCNGLNSKNDFPEAITKVNVEWDYKNIPYGAKYIRKWTMDGKEWIRYECLWSGSENGRDSVKLTEPKGLHSGTWELTITVNDEILLREQINVSGNWDYWDPAGSINSCYGTTN